MVPFGVKAASLLVVALVLSTLLGPDGQPGASPPEARLELTGPRQVVFDWSSDACTPTQVADLPARAFRDARGRVQLLLSHFENFRMIGPALGDLDVDCRPVMSSVHDADPAAYRDRQWIAAPYTEDGRHIWALVHDEYQGNRHPGRCPGGQYFRCWYNAVTLVVSTDGGRSYRSPRGRGLRVAGPPFRYRQRPGPVGVFSPTGLVRRGDGLLYALVRVKDRDRRGTCLIRSRNVAVAGSWRAWDGEGFDGVFTDPYRAAPRREADCALVAPGEIAEMTGSLTYNTELEAYLLLGMAPAEPGALVPGTGIYYSVSRDLIHWSPRRLLMRASTVHSFRCGGRSPIAYPSLIDPSSRSRTFASSDRSAFVYYTQFHYRRCHRTPDRDLVRVPVGISG